VLNVLNGLYSKDFLYLLYIKQILPRYAIKEKWKLSASSIDWYHSSNNIVNNYKQMKTKVEIRTYSGPLSIHMHQKNKSENRIIEEDKKMLQFSYREK